MVVLAVVVDGQMVRHAFEGGKTPAQSRRRAQLNTSSEVEAALERARRDVKFYRDYGTGIRSSTRDAKVMFWRPNKVGSTTLQSLLCSYAYRHVLLPRRQSTANYLCRKMALCALEHNNSTSSSPSSSLEAYIKAHYTLSASPASLPTQRPRNVIAVSTAREIETASELIRPFHLSIAHEVCNIDANLVRDNLACAFGELALPSESEARALPPGTILDPLFLRRGGGAMTSFPEAVSVSIKEIFLVREPLARAVSLYYFVGEMLKWWRRRGAGGRLGNPSKGGGGGGAILAKAMHYHGNESTPPPEHIALRFAQSPPYSSNGPTPARWFVASHSWSLFSNTVGAAVQVIESGRIACLVTERLDESLVILSHHMAWSLADVVVTKSRKAQSPHPSADAWPKRAVKALRASLEVAGEYQVYAAANADLDRRRSALERSGVAVQAEIELLRALRTRVQALCFSTRYLEMYRKFLTREGFPRHHDVENRLRESEDVWVEHGHSFSYNGEQLFSFDVCGPCEAHGLLLGLKNAATTPGGAAAAVGSESAMLLKDVPANKRRSIPQLRKCPNHEIEL